MGNPTDVERAKQGKEVWNLWAVGNPSAEVDFSEGRLDIDFSGFTFPGDANFKRVRFTDNAEFSGAEFSGDANFREANFSGGARFFCGQVRR